MATIAVHTLLCQHLWHFYLVLLQRHIALITGSELTDLLGQFINQIQPAVSPLYETDEAHHKQHDYESHNGE